MSKLLSLEAVALLDESSSLAVYEPLMIRIKSAAVRPYPFALIRVL